MHCLLSSCEKPPPLEIAFKSCSTFQQLSNRKKKKNNNIMLCNRQTVYLEDCFTEKKTHFHIISPGQDKCAKINFYMYVTHCWSACHVGISLTSSANYALPNDRIFVQLPFTCFFKKGIRHRATPANTRSRQIHTLPVSVGRKVIEELRDNLQGTYKLNGAWKIHCTHRFSCCQRTKRRQRESSLGNMQ